ncbi:uncharacterized protein LOC127007073 isoform X2 [Eriocheir sinensis]|uniref:uncharacterized protein LOC127007073 isoform X2 n=1 Tax=Eriocheir sinensis TaxID=95602 RepID=UPI0021C8A2D9|nr:uncharacterized protein LOC127007073 isoform X2 [Eriocheir sinensis]
MTAQTLKSITSLVYTALPNRPVCRLSARAQHAMAQRNRRQIYETAFDSKVERKGEEGGDLIDRIANHPILQLLSLRRRTSRSSTAPPHPPPSSSVLPSTSSDPKFQVGVFTPKGGRRERGRGRGGVAPRPARSVSTHHITERRVHPIALSKSDDEILTRGSDSLEEEDRVEDYVEGQTARELSAALQPNSMVGDDYFAHTEKKTPRKKKSRHRETPELSKSQAIPARAPPRPSHLRSPPGTAPLPLKFSKKPGGADKSPSSWFSPPRQKDLSLPIKRSHSKELTGLGTAAPPSQSHASLNASMEVLLDTSSQRELKGCLLPPPGRQFCSVESVVSSLESLRSSASEGSSAPSSYKSSSLGSDSSLLSRPALNLSAPHRSLIQSAKFQILSPISDKSQEPSSETGGGSQKASPQDLADMRLRAPPLRPSLRPQLRHDFRNCHHPLPGPGGEGDVQGSDSGISIEYGHHHGGSVQGVPYGDLPFDMPKLRRRLAAAAARGGGGKTSLSSSTSSISSGANSEAPHQPPTRLTHPSISRLQGCEGRSGTSSSTSSDWDTRSRSSADSSDEQGTPKLQREGSLSRGQKEGLALDLGCAALAIRGQKVDVKLPLLKQGWYHGALSRTEAEATLRHCAEGSYLVRSLHLARHQYSLALKSARGFMHLKIQFDHKTGQHMLGRGTAQFPSVPLMVQHYSIFRLPIKGAEHMVLLYPVIHETL